MFVNSRQAFVLADGLGRPSVQLQIQEKIKASQCVGAKSGGEPPHPKSDLLPTGEAQGRQQKAHRRRELQGWA
jgi:hypothetical protein